MALRRTVLLKPDAIAADTATVLDPAVQTMLTFIGGATLLGSGIVAVVATARMHLSRSLRESRRPLTADELPTIEF